MVSQVIKEVQQGLNKLEQTVAQNNPGASTGFQTEGFSSVPPQTSSPSQAESAPPAPTEPYTGQRWEYKVVYVNFRGQISSEGHQFMIGRGERRSSFVRNYLDEIGQQGWELSGVSPLGETENSYFVFKRPSTGIKPSPATSQTEDKKSDVEEVQETGQDFVAEA